MSAALPNSRLPTSSAAAMACAALIVAAVIASAGVNRMPRQAKAMTIGIALRIQPRLQAGLQHRAGLLWGERSGLTENVAELREVFLHDGGQHLVDQEAHVGIRISTMLWRHGMRPEEGRN